MPTFDDLDTGGPWCDAGLICVCNLGGQQLLYDYTQDI